MAIERIHRDSKRSPEEKGRLREIRERFQTERPNLKQLVAENGYNEPVPHGDYLGLQQVIAELKKAREAAGLSLGDVAEKTGIDKACLSRLETGRHINPTVSTLARYARAIGKRFRWSMEDAPPVSNPAAAATNPGNATAVIPPLGDRTPARPAPKLNPIVKAVRTAYLEVRGPERRSTDLVIADPVLDIRFLERCRQLGATGSDFELNTRLFNARKAKFLTDVPKATKFSLPREELDQFEFASEIALRIVLDQYRQQGMKISLDRLICNPELVVKFDELAARLAPGFTPLQYRWGAFGLRKAGRVKSEAVQIACPKFNRLGLVSDVKANKLPSIQGLYLIEAESAPLFVGDTLNLRDRIARHLRYCDGQFLPKWLFPGGPPDNLVLGILPMPELEPHAVEVREFKAKVSLKPALNYVA